MMSRSRSQGTEVTIVTGAFYLSCIVVGEFHFVRGLEKAAALTNTAA